MKLLLSLLLVTLAFSKISKEESILVLNDDNFQEALNKYPVLLVEFYAPWCGLSKRFAPEYAAAAKVLSTFEEPLFLAKVDCTKNPRVTKEYGISRLPTLKFFRNGVASDYTSGRKKEDVIAFMEDKSGPISVSYYSTAELKEALNKEGNKIVGYFESTDSPLYKEWYDVISTIEDVKAIHITDEDIAEDMGVEIPSIYIYENVDVKTQFPERMETFKKWVILKNLPPIVPFNQFYMHLLFSEDHSIRTQLLYFAPSQDLGEGDSILKEVAMKFDGKLFVVHIPSENGRLLEYFGIRSKEVPALVIADFGSSEVQKYRFTEKLTKDALIEFIEGFFDHTLKPYYKSEEVPEQVDLVYNIVGNTFNDVVFNSKKNVLVLFYAPWCSVCQSVKKDLKELSKIYEDSDDVVIGQMDATANEVEGIVIHSFPTIKFFKADSGNGSSIDYEGELTVSALNEFIEANRVSVDEEELKHRIVILSIVKQLGGDMTSKDYPL